MTIPFTQYLLPNGRTMPVCFEAKPEIEEKAKALIKNGCHFDIEVLTTGLVSMTCEDEEDVISITICDNGPGIDVAIRKTVEEAYNKLKIKKAE